MKVLSTDNQTLTNKIDYIGNIVYEHDTQNYELARIIVNNSG